ncbi:hypothetical protein L1049_020019 [Liquidambar formosana]|uniref:Tic22-like family protein n=1 Tax=Liquidambar formosana TaxID=63359 RepID=A0AAP0S6U0_LIQFO
MASSTESQHHPPKPTVRLIHSATSNLLSLLNSKTTPSRTSPTPTPSASPPEICFPLLYADSPSESAQSNSMSSKPAIKGAPSESGPGFPSTVRIARLNSSGKGGGPAFVGQVFSMCDLSGTGLMAVSTHFDIPFISKRTPDWIKKMFAPITKSDKNGPVFRFFMDLGDAVTYVKRLNIPSGVVGACRLDLAYEHFKEKPHLFQFVPNEKQVSYYVTSCFTLAFLCNYFLVMQVKEANRLLKTLPHNGGRRRVDGVPVFTAQNLDIAIATTDGIKWYTPYFFDKNMLDNILEDSVDQHFHSLIQSRHMQRRRDVIDDNLAAEVIEENGDNLWEPPEVQEVLDEMGHPVIPLSVISKAAEMQLLYAVDKVLLGNRWLRKATGIQPRFPYMVDSFEKRSAASLLKASESTSRIVNGEMGSDDEKSRCLGTSEPRLKADLQTDQVQKPHFWFPFGDWFSHLWSKDSKQQHTPQHRSDARMEGSPREWIKQELQPSPFLPKITMVGISMGEAGQMSKANLKKTMEDLTKELEQTEQGNNAGSYRGNEFRNEDRDPLFVANVGDYYSGVAKTWFSPMGSWGKQLNSLTNKESFSRS